MKSIFQQVKRSTDRESRQISKHNFVHPMEISNVDNLIFMLFSTILFLFYLILNIFRNFD